VSAGTKGASLHLLMKHGFNVPNTFICDWKAYQRFLTKDDRLESCLRHQLKDIIAPDKTYAVRSSANLEDNLGHSFAGQFDTFLNVRGVDEIMQAIKSVWLSIQTPVVHAYLEHLDIEDSDLLMAVLIQEMVKPIYSGVALSKNPVTGADEIVIEAVVGEGTQLVQSGITPDRWINRWGYWLEKAEQSQVPFTLVEKIAEQLKEIASRLSYPVDTEWVFDGQSLYWVQAREITALNTHNIYSNYLSREMMPGMLKPLSFGISAPLMSNSVLRWLREMIGDFNVSPQDLVKPFYYRAYFNMGAMGEIFNKFGFPTESIEMLIDVMPPGAQKPKIKPTLKTLSCVPCICLFLIRQIRFVRKTHRVLDKLESEIQRFSKHQLLELSPKEILSAVSRHNQIVEEIAYYASLSLFLLSMFNRVLKRQLASRGIEFSTFEVTENMPELDQYYPSTGLHELYNHYCALPPEKKTALSCLAYHQLQEIDGLDTFLEQFSALLDQFGHLGDSGNDFSIPPWRETPDEVLKMVTDYQPTANFQAPKINLLDLKARRQVTPMFLFFYHRVRNLQLLREKASNLYTRGKVIYRYYFLALGQQFTASGFLDNPEDIFYLSPSQVKQMVHDEDISDVYRSIVDQAKQDMLRLKDVQLPTIIYGEDPPPLTADASTKIMAGISTSIGVYTGPACVVKNMQEFPKLQQGDVLIIPYSDVSWAPLFTRAGALVSEAGGMLSHGSIVAREYNIPAIVSVDMATSIPDGTRLTVDAHNGLVHIHD
jgi:pyruvate,water dikinase